MSEQQSVSRFPGALPANVAAATADLVRLRHAARDLTLFPRLPPRAVSAGGHQSRCRGRGMDFDEVRPYQPGDDIRTIDWRVTARTTQTHTKVFREERERPVIVVVDLRQTMFFGSKKTKSVVACEVAAALAWAGCNAGDRVGGLVFAPDQQRDIRAGRSHHSVLQLIKILSDTSASLIDRRTDRFSLTQIFEDTRRIAHPGAAIVFISDFHDFDRDGERHLFELARHSDVTLCHIYDDLEVRLPPPGNYPVTNGGRRFTLNTRNVRTREAFELHKQKQFKALQQAATRLRLAYLQVRATDEIMPLLQNAYSNKIRRRRSR
tara:strand:+ start:8490 stop:9452 length:963 start_codon:yes stop_codon:yes gene_type:complete